MIDVMHNQRRTARSVLNLVRLGSQRAIGRIDSAWTTGIDQRMPVLGTSLRQTLIRAEKRIGGTTVQGFEAVTTLLDAGLDRAFDLASGSMRSDLARTLYGTPVYGAISVASMPVAKLSLKISSDVADRVEGFATRLDDATAVEPASKQQPPAARKRARKTVVATKAASRGPSATARRRAAS